jgi:hypothetical protein
VTSCSPEGLRRRPPAGRARAVRARARPCRQRHVLGVAQRPAGIAQREAPRDLGGDRAVVQQAQHLAAVPAQLRAVPVAVARARPQVEDVARRRLGSTFHSIRRPSSLRTGRRGLPGRSPVEAVPQETSFPPGRASATSPRSPAHRRGRTQRPRPPAPARPRAPGRLRCDSRRGSPRAGRTRWPQIDSMGRRVALGISLVSCSLSSAVDPEQTGQATIVATAIQLADTEGLDAVSTRRVAAALGTRPMGLTRIPGSSGF